MGNHPVFHAPFHRRITAVEYVRAQDQYIYAQDNYIYAHDDYIYEQDFITSRSEPFWEIRIATFL